MEPETRIAVRRPLPLIWLAALLLIAVLLPSRLWTTLVVGVAGLVAVAAYWVWQLKAGLRATRRLRYGWVSVGDRLSEHFEVRNECGVPALWVEVVDESNVPGYRAAVVRSVGAGQRDPWRQSAVCQQRGQFHLGPWSLRAGDPFGIFQLTVAYPQSEEIVIHPPIHVDLPVPLPAGQSSGRARARERNWQATINAAGVRDYQEHDPLRWIHWPTSARREALFVRQFDLDAAGDLWLLLDLQRTAQVGEGAAGTEEHAVLLAASLAAQALRLNRPVGLATYGRRPLVIPPAHGAGQEWRILRALALAAADGDYPLANALADLRRVARRGSAALIVTPSGAAGWLPELHHLAQTGVRCAVALLDRASFAAPEGEGATAGLREALHHLGYRATIVRQGEVGRPPEDAARRGFWEFRVTGTGRVVAVRRPEGG
jgi:uncharacterized protein (DUF58 family)